MAYEIRKTDGSFLVTVVDGTTDNTATSIKLIGKGYPNYGDEFNTDLVHIMENFANNISPSNPLIGQIWLDTSDTELKFWTGSTWKIINSGVLAGSDTYVERTGDEMIGPLVIDTASIGLTSYSGTTGLISETITVANTDSSIRSIDLVTYGKTGLGRRWRLQATNDVESGSDVGSDFSLSRYDDSDSLIDYVMKIDRVSGDFDFNSHALTNIAQPINDTDAATKQYVDDYGSGELIGETKMVAGNTLPPGWLRCDGSAVSRTTYSILFAEIGVTYGIGDGLTTFNVPNIDGRFPVGTGDSGTTGSSNISLGGAGGTAQYQLVIDEMPSHTHGLNSVSTGSSGAGRVQGSGSAFETSSTGGDQPHENMPPYLGFNFIIYAGV